MRISDALSIPVLVLCSLASAGPCDPATLFAPQVVSTTGGATSPLGFSAVNLDADGVLDLIVALGTSDQLLPMFGVGDGSFFTGAPVASTDAPAHALGGDFNNDGNVDAIVVNAITGPAILYHEGLGGGNFAPGVDVDPSWGFPTPHAVSGDFNQDGELDFAVAVSGVNVRAYAGNGDGTFQAAVLGNTHFSTTVELAVADLNGDGDPDLVGAGASFDHVLVLMGGAGVGFGSLQELDSAIGLSGVCVADLNNDGAPDLISSSAFESNVGVHLGLGGGLFGGLTTYPAGFVPRDLVAHDFDGDGNIDVVTVNEFDRTVTVLPGQGDGTLGAPLAYPVAGNPMRIGAHDVNGDGAMDVVVSTFGGNSVSVLLNTCDAAPTPCNDADMAPPLGVLDFSDVLAFLTAFAMMDASADLAPPLGVWDFSDVLAFLGAFGAGCP